MPHDKKGRLLKQGDTVSLTGTVESISEGAETCNVVVRDEQGEGHTLTASHLEKVDAGAESTE